jgi:acyl carrier protein
MSANTFTQEQILSGIRIFLRENLGCESPFDADVRIHDYLETEKWWDGLDIMDFVYGLEELFGFSCSRKEWNDYFGVSVRDVEEWKKTVSPRLTFRALADFIRERLNPIALEPVTLLGKPCLTAGVFRGLEQLAVQVNPRVGRFAPSTPIRQCLRGARLHRFWNRLRWMLEDQLPPSPEIHFGSRGLLHSLIFKLGAGLTIALWRRDLPGAIFGILTTLALFIPVGMIVDSINKCLMNPLPEGIETFGDLAGVLSAIILDQQSEAASCSTP